MFKMIIAANSVDEMNSKITELYKNIPNTSVGMVRPSKAINSIIEKEAHKLMNSEPFPITQEAPQQAVGPVVSVGKEWGPVPGMPGAYQGVPVREALNQAPENVPASLRIVPTAPGSSGGPVSEDRDSVGMPFDIRIHAATRTFTKDGAWKYKRGTEDAFIHQVEAELKARMAYGSVPAQPLAPPPAVTVSVDMPNFAVPGSQPIAPPIQTVKSFEPIPVAPAPTPTQTGAYDFNSFRNQIPNILMNLANSKKLTPEYLQQLKEYFNVKEIWDIVHDEKKSYELFENFASYGFITKVN